ncbi:carbohydrate ABC transporter permease [Bradyrhizobium sp. 2TAF24]|uniref:carbohydrate ABC transporter permease n=1 Tax=Bradyrhizobium sp. 2TAF24 TaxID=3233011 RepID=UPI003F8F5313
MQDAAVRELPAGLDAPVARFTVPRPGDTLRFAVLALLAAFSVLPILVMLSTSLKTQSQTFGDFTFLAVPTLENYRSVLEGRFLGYLANSVIVSIAATLLTLVFGTMCAYALSRFRFRGRSSLAIGTLLLRTVPPAVLAIPAYFILTPLHLDGLTGLVISYVALNLPFTIWLLYGFVEQVPVELEEAATVDGCGPYRLFFTLILPLLKPGLAAAAIFTFRIGWNELVLASILTNRASRTLPYGVYLYITDVGVDWGRLMAAGMLVALPPLIFTFVAARQIIAGLTAGAVKG